MKTIAVDDTPRRWLVLAAGVVIQTILGGIYAWSAFSPALIDGFGLTPTQTSAIFGIGIGTFAATTLPGGYLFAHKGPRITALLGAVLFSSGYGLAALSQGNFILLLLGIGILGGAGTGLGYVCPITVGMQWFPERKGLVTGVSVAGFGGGAILLTEISRRVLTAGQSVLDVFGGISWFGGGLLVLAAAMLTSPSKRRSTTNRSVSFVENERSTRALLTHGFFLLHLLGMFTGTFCGLLVIGNLASLALSKNLQMDTATLAVSLFAVGNASGRLVWGALFDKVSHWAIPLSLGGVGGLLLLYPMVNGAWHFIAFSLFVGFGFGSNFVVYAASLSRYFGTDAFLKLYPLIFLGYGLAGILGPVAGVALARLTGNFSVPVVLCGMGCLAMGWVVFYRAIPYRHGMGRTRT